MFGSKPRKRPASTSSLSQELTLPNEITGLLDCYDFLSPNEYSEKTFGLLAFLLRKSVGETNFSDIFNEAEKRDQQEQIDDYVTLLEKRRANLPEIEASIEKCLMLNRLIKYIQENKLYFNSIISDIRIDMKTQMIDNQVNQSIQYPNDFCQREKDFMKRKNAQDMRRLFFLSHSEAKAPSLIYLQNRTTEHLSYLIDCKMRYDSKFCDKGLKELEKIFSTSFMITVHPHSGGNPVFVYDRKGPGVYTVKVSVTIVSLLHDFIQTHPNLIKLYDIELSLCSPSPLYKLQEPLSISWKTCQLQAYRGDKPRIIQYAELSFITIQQTSKTNTSIRVAQPLHSLKVAIRLHLNLTEHKISKTYQIPLESLSFGIVSHNSYIPHMLTRIILDDIRRFSQLSSVDVKIVMIFILRYFIHRTGVEPNKHLQDYLEQELNRAIKERMNYQTLEDVFMDFLVLFVRQVEFMAKHTVLAMFYADNLCLGPCNSVHVAEIMKKSTDINSPIVGLRLDSIKVDYKATASTTTSFKTMKSVTCSVRVDIYNKRTSRFQNRTFDSSKLLVDISKFVSTAVTDKTNGIRILSNLDDRINAKNYKFYTDFTKYYHERLHEISKINEKYKPVTNLISDIEDDDDDKPYNNGSQNTDSNEICLDNLHSASIDSSAPFNNEDDPKTTSVPNHVSTSSTQSDINTTPLQNVLSSSNQQPPQQLNGEGVIQYVLSQPDILTELLRRVSSLRLSAGTASVQHIYYPPQIQMPYQNQPTSVQVWPQYCQQSPQMQFSQQQQLFNQQFHQQQAFPPMMLNQPTNINQYQPLQTFPRNDIQRSFQQNSTHAETLQMSEDVLNQSTIDLVESMIANQTLSTTTNEYIPLLFEDISPFSNTE